MLLASVMQILLFQFCDYNQSMVWTKLLGGIKEFFAHLIHNFTDKPASNSRPSKVKMRTITHPIKFLKGDTHSCVGTF